MKRKKELQTNRNKTSRKQTKNEKRIKTRKKERQK